MLPSHTFAASFVPSAEEAIPTQYSAAPVMLTSVQFAPLLLEIHMLPKSIPAASFVPSAEEASPPHSPAVVIEVTSAQFAPLSLEVIMFSYDGWALVFTTNFVPSAEEVIRFHFFDAP